MALITTGSLLDFSVTPKKSLRSERFSFAEYSKLFGRKNSFTAFRELSRLIPPDSIELMRSKEPRGVALKSFELRQGFEWFLQNIWNSTNEIYFIAWAWDLSGMAPNYYPGDGTNPNDALIRIKVGNLREFIGTGLNLFPKRTVTGGIALRIQVWESDLRERSFARAMEEAIDTIQNSDLNNLLNLISTATGITGATITLIEKASLELAKLIGTILKANSDDYVDFFEGYYAADAPWTTGLDKYDGNSSTIVLDKY
ncbi:MAG TPA: hypothetical protein VHO50_13060 [Bacteroidales bacterium]|nr:hypothetical protein [Bacteroidales bacterium]